MDPVGLMASCALKGVKIPKLVCIPLNRGTTIAPLPVHSDMFSSFPNFNAMQYNLIQINVVHDNVILYSKIDFGTAPGHLGFVIIIKLFIQSNIIHLQIVLEMLR